MIRGSSASKSVVVLMDARQGCWRLLRASTEQVQITLANHLAAVWALKPEPFWEKQHVECVKSRQDCKVTHTQQQYFLYININRRGLKHIIDLFFQLFLISFVFLYL